MPIEQPPVRFGTFEFDVMTLELKRQGVRVAIEPQPARALALLLQAEGDVVSREALKQALWKDGVHVDFDRGLAYVIGQVRSALGDSADNPRFVETLPKRGFRFIAPVVTPAAVPRAMPAGAAPAPASPSKPRRTLAILGTACLAVAVIAAIFAFTWKKEVLAVAVFDNETGNAQYDSFTNGLPDALIAHLGRNDTDRIGLVGNARTLRMPRSERDLNQIRAETGASFILLGQLQTLEGGVRLITHLIRLKDGRHVWVKRFDRPGGNLEGFEAEVLAQVEEGVRLRVVEGLPAPKASSTPSANR